MSYITFSALNSNMNDQRLYVNGNNHGNNRNGYAFEIALSKTLIMKTYNNLSQEITSEKNLLSAYRKARKSKSKKGPDKNKIKIIKDILKRNPNGLWLREIARKTKISKSSVHKYINEYMKDDIEDIIKSPLIRLIKLK